MTTLNARLLSFFFLTVPAILVEAQTNAAAPAAAAMSGPKSTEDLINEIKNPVPWFSWGGDLRLRNEYLNNTITLSPTHPLHEQDYFRFRGRVWASLLPVDDVSLNARLAAEPREWMKPAGYTPMRYGPPPLPGGHMGPDWTEGIIDNLNVQWRNILGQPASIIVGRQDIFLGDGWLVGDGTPLDGSWTYYLDSVRGTYQLKEAHTTIEAIGIIQDARDNGWLPPIAEEPQHRMMTEQNEKGAILNVANTSVKEANVTGYFIYKHDDQAVLHDVFPFPPPRGDNADIYTLGGRITGTLGEHDHWKYWVEGAYQFGQKADQFIHDTQFPTGTTAFRSMDAFGVNNKLTYLFKDKLNNQVTLAYEFLTGDDPNSKNDEMFDVLWGRWPQWSEIGLYSFAAETRVGQEANLHRLGPTWSVTPLKGLDFSASYNVLLAEQDVATRAANPALFSGDGVFRGHFVSAILKYKFSSHLSGHLWSELEFPGDYYANRQMMSFLRAEIMMTF